MSAFFHMISRGRVALLQEIPSRYSKGLVQAGSNIPRRRRWLHALQILGTEWVWIIFLVAILLFGSKKIPEMARGLGKAMGEFQKGKMEIEREIREASNELKSVSTELKDTANTFSPQNIIQSATAPPVTLPPTGEPPGGGVVEEGIKPPTEPIPLSPQKEELAAEGIERIYAAAKALGIETQGKTDQQIREEIKSALEKAS